MISETLKRLREELCSEVETHGKIISDFFNAGDFATALQESEKMTRVLRVLVTLKDIDL